MRKDRCAFKVLVLGLVLVVQSFHAPIVADGREATLTGSILLANGDVPLAGAKLHVGDRRSGAVFSSQPTGPDGAFFVGDLPGATYELAVESDRTLYVISQPIQLASGETRGLKIAVNGQTEPTGKGKKGQTAKKPRPWSNPVTATLLAVGSAVVVGLVVEAAGGDDGDDDEQASPFD